MPEGSESNYQDPLQMAQTANEAVMPSMGAIGGRASGGDNSAQRDAIVAAMMAQPQAAATSYGGGAPSYGGIGGGAPSSGAGGGGDALSRLMADQTALYEQQMREGIDPGAASLYDTGYGGGMGGGYSGGGYEGAAYASGGHGVSGGTGPGFSPGSPGGYGTGGIYYQWLNGGPGLKGWGRPEDWGLSRQGGIIRDEGGGYQGSETGMGYGAPYGGPGANPNGNFSQQFGPQDDKGVPQDYSAAPRGGVPQGPANPSGEVNRGFDLADLSQPGVLGPGMAPSSGIVGNANAFGMNPGDFSYGFGNPNGFSPAPGDIGMMGPNAFGGMADDNSWGGYF